MSVDYRTYKASECTDNVIVEMYIDGALAGYIRIEGEQYVIYAQDGTLLVYERSYRAAVDYMDDILRLRHIRARQGKRRVSNKGYRGRKRSRKYKGA